METALLISIAAIVVLLVLSGLFSGSETALTAASRSRMHHLEGQGNKRARIVNRLSVRRDRMISAILFGNNLVNILASALATGLLIGWVGDAGIAYATIIMTVLIYVFAEVLPKTYAIRNADRFALAMAPAVRTIVRLLSPLTRAVDAVVRLTLRVFGVKLAAEALVTPADELRGSIGLHARQGGMAKVERDMLDSILDLADVDVEEIMVHRKGMTTIDADLPPTRIVEEVLRSPFTRIPLWRDDPDNIVGVIHAKDLLRALMDHDGDADNLDIAALATEPWFVPDTATLSDQLRAFRKRRAHFALVVDEYGALMGILTLEDILEEIVGDIADEHDVEFKSASLQPDGSVIVGGTTTIRDLNREFEWQLPDEEAATIAGLVIHEVERIPEAGETFAFHGFQFEVLRRQRNQITSLRLTPQESTADDPATS